LIFEIICVCVGGLVTFVSVRVWHGILFFKSGNWFCEMTFWVGHPFVYFKDPKMKKGIRALRIDSPKNKNLFGHASCP
jgi:hypothetical protein